MKYPTKNEIISCVKFPNFIKDNLLKGGTPTSRTGGGIKHWSGGFSIVFQVEKNGEFWAFKVWHTPIEGLKDRYSVIKKHLESSRLPYFVDFGFSEKGLFVNNAFLETQRMKWIAGLNLKDFINININNPRILLSLAINFRAMVKDFREHGISHGDLQHGNIVVTDDNQLLVIDYDSMYVEGLSTVPDLIKGQAGYQHPQRQDNAFSNERMDYFSELVIYLSLHVYAESPDLWNNDTDWLLFSKEDLATPEESLILQVLKRTTDPMISLLTSRLLQFLNCTDINKLQPLEDVLTSNIQIDYPFIDNIVSKF